MNMFKPVGAHSIEEYMHSLPLDRKKILEQLHAFITKQAPSLTPHFASNMIGYGSFKYHNYKKEIIDWPTVAVASQKNYVSLYVCSVVDGVYVAEKYAKELGTVQVGKSCIRFKKFEDLNLAWLKKVLMITEKNPGL